MTDNPNKADNSKISRRNILAGAAGGAAAVSVGAIIGHAVSWEGAAGSYPVNPYTLSRGAMETFKIRERIHLEIDGVGSEVVEMNGTAVFRRHDPKIVEAAAAAGMALSWSTASVDVDFVALDTQGKSSLFGQVHASLVPGGTAGAHVRPTDYTQSTYGVRGAEKFATAGNKCQALINPQFRLEELQKTVGVGDAVVELGSEVSVIPPVGDVARTTGRYPLYSSAGIRVGELLGADIEIGEIVDRKPLSSSLV